MSVSQFFLDTNILIYANTAQAPEKQSIAQRLIASGNAIVSAQVLNEFCNVLRRKFPDKFLSVESVLLDFQVSVDVMPLTADITN